MQIVRPISQMNDYEMTKVEDIKGRPRMLVVKVDEGRQWLRNIDGICKRSDGL